jgi:AraC-like DNA-binding protein
VIKIEGSIIHDFLKLIGKSLHIKPTQHSLSLIPPYGEGTIQEWTLNNGVQLFIYNYIPYESFLFQYKKTKKEFYFLRLDEVNSVEAAAASKSSILLGSTKYDVFYLANAHFHVKSIHLFFSKEWLYHWLYSNPKGEEIGKYLSLKGNTYLYENMDTEYKQWMHEILNEKDTNSLSTLVIQNRAMLIVERFFSRLYFKMNEVGFNTKLSNDEIQRLKLAEQALVQDFSMPVISVSELSKMAAMSPSKLKVSFKKLYQLPIYQYYQKQRMNKAKAMLLSRKYTVKEVAEEVGFYNIHHFTKAFQNFFGQLPHEVAHSTTLN